jgi:hypothetical protein
MPPVGFEPTIPASARRQTYVLDRAATGIGVRVFTLLFVALCLVKDKQLYFLVEECG